VIPFEPLWAQYKRLIKDNGAIVLFGSQPFTSVLVMSNQKMFKYCWNWKKDKAANWMFGNKMPLKIFEDIAVFYELQPTYNPQKRINPEGVSTRHLYKNPSKITKNVRQVMGDAWKETVLDDTQNYHGSSYEPDKLLPTTELYFAREQRGKEHPTQKPVALFEYLIRTYTNEGDTVLDNCAGSFTTAIACINTNRNYICIEKDDKYFEIGKNRIENHQPLLQAVNV
jgi:site-specific DNA-methyltransferase (adenine-specific)